MSVRNLYTKEHDTLYLGEDDKDIHDFLFSQIRSADNTRTVAKIRFLGLEYNYSGDSFISSFYVGADWIDKKKDLALVVKPKIHDIDFQSMLMRCFQSCNTNLDGLFHIRIGEKPIPIPYEDFQIEPFIIVYFLNLVTKIAKKGLRHDYIMREERLNSKIKGKIMMGKYVQHGIAINRKDQVDCRFQEYSIDCLDNRILKKALIVCHEMLRRNTHALGSHFVPLENLYKESIAVFEKVTSDVSSNDLQRVHINPLFKDYKQAIPLAKMIIRKQGFCVGKTENGEQLFPPFIIDMPILFEQYVHALLIERYGNYEIGYQVGTTGNIMDFCKYDEHLIMDSKYITKWDEHIEHDNVRQLSGYARNISLRKKLCVQDHNYICPCVIIYPDIHGLETLKDLGDELFTSPELTPIPDYLKFRKLPIRLPIRTKRQIVNNN